MEPVYCIYCRSPMKPKIHDSNPYCNRCLSERRRNSAEVVRIYRAKEREEWERNKGDDL